MKNTNLIFAFLIVLLCILTVESRRRHFVRYSPPPRPVYRSQPRYVYRPPPRPVYRPPVYRPPVYRPVYRSQPRKIYRPIYRKKPVYRLQPRKIYRPVYRPIKRRKIVFRRKKIVRRPRRVVRQQPQRDTFYYPAYPSKILPREATRCSKSNCRNVRSCAKYVTSCVGKVNRCTTYQRTGRKVCKKYSNSKYCARFGTQTKRYCKGYHPNFCLRYQWNTKRYCATYRNRCNQYSYSSRRFCVRGKRVCRGWSTVSHRKCLRWYTKCTKYSVSGRTVCTKYGLPRCKQFATRTNKYCAKSVRRCAQVQTVKKTFCLQKKRACVKYGRFTRCAKKAKRCVKFHTKKYCQAYGKRCIEYKITVVKPKPKKCGTKIVYKFINKCQCKKSKAPIPTLAYRKVSRRRVIRKCVKYATTCKKFGFRKTNKCAQYVNTCLWITQGKCQKFKTVCTKTGFQLEKTCKRYKNVCAKYSISRQTYCKAYGSRPCVQYKTVKTKKCVKVGRKCAGWKSFSRRNCSKGYKHKCVQWKTRKIRGKCLRNVRFCGQYKSKRTRGKCIAYSRMKRRCKHWGFRKTRVCSKYAWRRVCAGYKMIYSQRCVKFTPHCKKTKRVCASWRSYRTCKPCVATVCGYHYFWSQAKKQRQCCQYSNGRFYNCYRTGVLVGHPHLESSKGEDRDEQETGAFVFYKNDHFEVQVNYVQIGGGVKVGGVAMKQGDKIFYAFAKHKTGFVIYAGGFHYTKNGNIYKVESGKGDFVSITYDPSTNSLSLELSDAKAGTGLFNGGKQDDYRVNPSLFGPTEYRKVKGKRDWKLFGQARKWCSSLKGNFRDDCIDDVLKTGLNWGAAYARAQKAEKL